MTYHANPALRFCAGCGERRHAMCHNATSPKFDHNYVNVRDLRRREARAKVAPLLCERCTAGTHDGERSEIGCLETVAPEPRNFVCTCPRCRVTARPHVSVPRSDAERVVHLHFIGGGL